MKKIIVFGAGKSIETAINYLEKKYTIIGVVDNDLNKLGRKIGKIEIKRPDIIDKSAYPDTDIVIVSERWQEILEQLYTDFNITNAYRYDQTKTGISLISVSACPLYRDIEPRKLDVDAKRLRFPHHTLNGKKNILVIAYYFPPMGASPVQRTLKFVKYLSEMGYHVTVICSTANNYPKKDETLLSEVPDEVDVIRIPDRYRPGQELSIFEQQRILDFIGSIDDTQDFIESLRLAQREQIKYIIPDVLIEWAVDAYEFLLKEYTRIESDIVYSTVPEFSPHLLAYLIKRTFKIPWIGDYRDPWVASEVYAHAVYPRMVEKEICCMQSLEKKLLQEMDYIIIAGNNWRQMFLEKYGIGNEKIKEISNGYDEDDFKELVLTYKINNRFTICYNGLLGYNRKPAVVLEAINSLIDENKVDKNKIVWIFNGAISESLYNEQIKPYDKYGIVKMNGMLSHKDSLRNAQSSDLLVAYGECGDMAKFNYPGKFYEYLRCGRPILFISDAGSPQESMLNETGLGVNCPFGNMRGIKNYIYKIYTEWASGSVRISHINTELINRYERRELTKKLAGIIDIL